MKCWRRCVEDHGLGRVVVVERKGSCGRIWFRWDRMCCVCVFVKGLFWGFVGCGFVLESCGRICPGAAAAAAAAGLDGIRLSISCLCWSDENTRGRIKTCVVNRRCLACLHCGIRLVENISVCLSVFGLK